MTTTVTTTARATIRAEQTELPLPRTDAGALALAAGEAAAYTGLLIAVRRNRDLMRFVGGLAALTFAWFALRAIH